MFSVGVKEGLEYANRHKDVDVIFVTKDKKVYVSDMIKETFKLNKRSTWVEGVYRNDVEKEFIGISRIDERSWLAFFRF